MTSPEGPPQDHNEETKDPPPQVAHITEHGRRITLVDFSVPAINDGRPADVDGTLAVVRAAAQSKKRRGNRRRR
jgi:hypothetical protein